MFNLVDFLELSISISISFPCDINMNNIYQYPITILGRWLRYEIVVIIVGNKYCVQKKGISCKIDVVPWK